jgi:hypothetical protein
MERVKTMGLVPNMNNHPAEYAAPFRPTRFLNTNAQKIGSLGLAVNDIT